MCIQNQTRYCILSLLNSLFYHPGLQVTLANDLDEYQKDLGLEPGFVMSLSHKPCPNCLMEFSEKLFIQDSRPTNVVLKQVNVCIEPWLQHY